MAVSAWKTRSQLANKIGKGKYVLAEYEKIKRITMPLMIIIFCTLQQKLMKIMTR